MRLVALALAASVVSGIAQPVAMVRVPESTLRKSASKVIMPAFPIDAARAGKGGVAVAEVTVDAAGHVSGVVVLEAPAESITLSLIGALKQWEFRPLGTQKQPVGMVGKITYYFLRERGK